METLELLRANLLSPAVLAFALGIVATLVRSDLRIPEALYTSLSIYLLLAIGLKGGAALAATPWSELWKPALATLALGVFTPLLSYAVLRRLGRMDVVNAAALAAHYGSVSAVTFIAANSLMQSVQQPVEGYLPTLVAILEVPAIVIALLIARRNLKGGPMGEAVREILTGRSVLLLVGGSLIGFLSGPEGLKKVAAAFVDPFQGVLVLFLLELGMVAAKRLRDLRSTGAFLIGFGLGMPVVQGALGVWLGSLAGMSVGGATVLGAMAASASYIAAPAAVRIALPQANPSYYLTASLGITFPFNLTLGIPLYFALSRSLHGGA
ncbi:MAG: sodium-dependent bicarbonate transport family permease [Meiothermus sp.]|uniref:sodium-dependent bicarbonate transport family permease n=1 Tax=Meiothermus sp. TaxID=1955249 RepID=UPI002623AEC8|nr:sodium-dependent bicarbonate transport family permease [Meiothermus sp.]MCS7058202.1 sodium-dependent bicarbonate transport family permease [Meiothermus sp.]MCX7739462.1 sodium-dependent bicarbonate transport family permease [Meiothermus sp.]MDW8481364.1 sodium-dependent bicarbonate transport family permease [Meiothermus sp.]